MSAHRENHQYRSFTDDRRVRGHAARRLWRTRAGTGRRHAAPGAGAPPGADPVSPATGTAAASTPRVLAAAAQEPGEWFTGGRDQAGTYHSPLKGIDTGNVGRLGFAWQFVLDTFRGLEATPIVIDGVMYAAGNWGRVYALDARSGRELWRHVPAVDGQWARHACCDVVNRGLAVWQGRVYVGTIDGWLEALDARNGAVAWRVDTLVGRGQHAPYTVSGAPLIAGDVVIIGNGGADFGVRGYVSAYDLASGALKWRFYTVPRDPELGPQDQPHLEKAAATWDPAGSWRAAGGGGTVWDGMAYDPELKLVYLGTGNASPYDWKARSPAAATTSTSPRSSPCTSRTARSPGTTRRCRASAGTTPRR
ncbi:MAG: PQQ-binding-like beta-propeller repeat protein [Steroidobacteraceae bacterium]